MDKPKIGEHPLDALALIDCRHFRHHTMCVQCAGDAMRPEVERLRVELARWDGHDALTAHIVKRVEAERDRLVEQARKMLARATEWEAAAHGADNEQANTRYWCAREVRGIFIEAPRAVDGEEARDDRLGDERLTAIRKGAEAAKQWPAPAGSRSVAERADDLLALCHEVEQWRANFGESALRDRLAQLRAIGHPSVLDGEEG